MTRVVPIIYEMEVFIDDPDIVLVFITCLVLPIYYYIFAHLMSLNNLLKVALATNNTIDNKTTHLYHHPFIIYLTIHKIIIQKNILLANPFDCHLQLTMEYD